MYPGTLGFKAYLSLISKVWFNVVQVVHMLNKDFMCNWKDRSETSIPSEIPFLKKQSELKCSPLKNMSKILFYLCVLRVCKDLQL